MSSRRLVIAIDGPAASGKSTTAHRVAGALGFLHVDTGAMYRAVTLKVLRAGIDPLDRKKITELIRSTHVELLRSNGGNRVMLDGEDVTDRIRSADVTRSVSAVSMISAVRKAMVREQRNMGNAQSIVLEGRDIGTVVFPDADLKIFMVARIEPRARRRQEELRKRGIDSPLDVLRKEIEERDHIDSSREESPLRKAPDAIELDTSELTIEEQVDFVVQRAVKLLNNA